MLVYNTTFHIEEEVEKNFLIWINEVYIPLVQKYENFIEIRLCKILSHKEEGHASYSLQWLMADSSKLHQWHLQEGMKLNEQIQTIFKDKVLGIPTLMEIME